MICYENIVNITLLQKNSQILKMFKYCRLYIYIYIYKPTMFFASYLILKFKNFYVVPPILKVYNILSKIYILVPLART